MSTEEKFNAAVNVIRNLPKSGPFQPSSGLMLKFYAYYKQATEGPNVSTKPPFWDVIKKAKWDAWNKLGDMSRETAMDLYVEEFKKVVEKLSYTHDVNNLTDPVYASVPVKDLELLVGPVVERVRSQPGSPFSRSPITSREASPQRSEANSVTTDGELELSKANVQRAKDDGLTENGSISSTALSVPVQTDTFVNQTELSVTVQRSMTECGVDDDEEDTFVDTIENSDVNKEASSVKSKSVLLEQYKLDRYVTKNHFIGNQLPLSRNKQENISGSIQGCALSKIGNSPTTDIGDVTNNDERKMVKRAIMKLQQDVEGVFKTVCTLEMKIHQISDQLHELREVCAALERSVFYRSSSSLLVFTFAWPIFAQLLFAWAQRHKRSK